MREGGRLKKRDIESETDVPKLYTYNEYEHSVSRSSFRQLLKDKYDVGTETLYFYNRVQVKKRSKYYCL